MNTDIAKSPLRSLLATLAAACLVGTAAPAAAAQFTMLGSPADSIEFRALQQPFATRLAQEAAAGAARIELQPGSAGAEGKDLLARLSSAKTDVVVIGAAQLRDLDPALELSQLAGLAFDLPRARTLADALRPNLEKALRERHGVKLLALDSAQAQVLYCRAAFKSLTDIKGRRVRAQGAMLVALIEALGATPVPMAADAVVPALRAGTLDCAVGGTMQGNAARWFEHSAHLFSLPLAWDLNLYLADERNWSRLDGAGRQALQAGLRTLEARVWDSGLVYTREGINCNAGVEPCKGGQRGRMNIVIGSDADRALISRLANEVVLPQWARRCGAGCSGWFNDGVARLAGVRPIGK